MISKVWRSTTARERVVDHQCVPQACTTRISIRNDFGLQTRRLPPVRRVILIARVSRIRECSARSFTFGFARSLPEKRSKAPAFWHGDIGRTKIVARLVLAADALSIYLDFSDRLRAKLSDAGRLALRGAAHWDWTRRLVKSHRAGPSASLLSFQSDSRDLRIPWL